MNVYELDYRNRINGKISNEKVRAIYRRGLYYVQLPEGDSNKLGQYQEIAVTDGESWQYISKKPESETFDFRVWLHEDGTIEYADGIFKTRQVAPDKFDENSENSKFPYDIARNLYSLKRQLEYLQDLQNKLKSVRLKRLEIRMRKLGYTSFKDALSPITSYNVLCNFNDICEELEQYRDYIAIDGFSRRENISIAGETESAIVYSKPTEFGKDNLIAVLQEILSEIKRETRRLEEIIEMNDRKKSLVDGIAVEKPAEFDMEFPRIVSMPEKEWEMYSSYIIGQCKEYWPQDTESEKLKEHERMPKDALRIPNTKPVPKVLLNNTIWQRYTNAILEIANLYLSLNADILDVDVAAQVEDLTGVYGEESEEYSAGEELRNSIGELIDSDTFNIASNIEDIVICAKSLDFIRLMDNLLANDKGAEGLKDSVNELKADSIEEIKSRMKHVAMFMNAQRKRKSPKKVAPNFDDDDGMPGNR